MAGNVLIEDAVTRKRVEVGQHNQLVTSPRIPDVLPREAQNRFTTYNALLGSAGAVETGLTNANMNLDGSSTSLEFYVGAEEKVDIKIMRVIITIADSAVAHNNFGNVSALTNGFTLQVFERGVFTNLLNGVKTGGQMLLQSGMFSPYGDGATMNELTNHTANADAQTVVIDVSAIVPGGIRIARQTEDKIFATVADNLTGLTEFTVRIMGHRHHE